MIKRNLENTIKMRMFKGKVIIVMGPRQVGKTTLLKTIVENMSIDHIWLNGDEPDIREILTNTTSTNLKHIIGEKKLVVIDEAQRIENIGLTVKLIVDQFPEKQLLLTGSSSLELANTIKEPLTGRKFQYMMFPISYSELVNHTSYIEEGRLLEHRLIFGQYPDVVMNPGNEKEILYQLASSYLYKDIFAYETIKKPAVLEKLLQALALQLGNEVSYYELSSLIGIDPATVEKYVDLLEKSFVLFKLPSFSRNMRNEIKKGRKIYFYDTGIRNAIIKNFSPLALRIDTGGLWENYLIAERLKYNHYNFNYSNYYFWRTHGQQEIDFIEENEGNLHAYEFKWNPKAKIKFPKSFVENYPNSITNGISKNTYQTFLLGE